MTVEWNPATKRAISRQVGEWERYRRFLNGIGGTVNVGEASTHIEVVPTPLNRLFVLRGIQKVHVYDTTEGLTKFRRVGKPIERRKYIQGNGAKIRAW